jgi:SAM-dependent methyltransferase
MAPHFPVDAFAGTAECYARYRPPYPRALLDDLLTRAGVSGEGRLLDLACGPGRIATPLAASFAEVWAVDLEPEMIAEGRVIAERQGLTNITWVIGKAEDLEAESASFELIVIGEAFHRLDQPLVAAKALTWLGPGCCIATMGCHGIMSGTEPWQRTVAETVCRWTEGGSGGDPADAKLARGPEHCERVLRDAGFVDVASYSFVQPHDWTIESYLGYLYSTSFCSVLHCRFLILHSSLPRSAPLISLLLHARLCRQIVIL